MPSTDAPTPDDGTPPADVPPPGPADAADAVDAPSPVPRRMGPRTVLTVAAGLLLLATVGLVVIRALVSLNDAAGSATTADVVALEGRPARSAAPRARDLDPFAEVVFFRVRHTEPVGLLAEPGGGGVVATVGPDVLVAADPDVEVRGGVEWLHVHDALTGTWGWIPSTRAEEG